MPPRDSAAVPGSAWRVSVAGRLLGPMDEAGLLELARSGRLARYSLVHPEGTGEWRPVFAVPELAALLPDLPAAPPVAFCRARPSWFGLLATVAALLLVGGYWAGRAGWLDGAREPSNRATLASPRQRQAQVLAARATAALRERRWAEGVGAGRQYLAAADGGATASLAQQQAWAGLILGQLAPDRGRASGQTIPLLKTCLDWAPARAPQVAQRSLVFAQDALATRPLQIDEAEAYFEFALGLGREETPTSVTQIAWAALARGLSDPSALGRKAFSALFARCVMDDLPETVTDHPAWTLAQALHLLEQGDWAQAQPLLREVAASPADAALAAVARKALAPPEPGRREFERPPVILRTLAKRPALRIELVAADVTDKEIRLELRLANTAVRRQTLTYAVAAGDGRQAYEPLCLIDDHGRVVAAPLGFGEAGRPLPGRDNLWGIELARGERMTLQARFPLVDPGATRVRFVSPRHPGQSEWGWADLTLKAGPLDPPLTLLPLRTGEPSKKEIAPVRAATEVRPTTVAATITTTAAERTAQPSVVPAAAPQPPVAAEPAPAPAPKAPASPKKTMAPTRAFALRQQAQAARAQCQSRLASGSRALKRSLFEAAEQQRQVAERAYQGGDYGKAEVYFEQAIEIFKQVPR